MLPAPLRNLHVSGDALSAPAPELGAAAVLEGFGQQADPSVPLMQTSFQGTEPPPLLTGRMPPPPASPSPAAADAGVSPGAGVAAAADGAMQVDSDAPMVEGGAAGADGISRGDSVARLPAAAGSSAAAVVLGGGGFGFGSSGLFGGSGGASGGWGTGGAAGGAAPLLFGGLGGGAAASTPARGPAVAGAGGVAWNGRSVKRPKPNNWLR